MKKYLLLMVTVLGLFSCQKNVDSGCPYANASSKTLNDITLFTQTCGEIFKDSLYITYSNSRQESTEESGGGNGWAEHGYTQGIANQPESDDFDYSFSKEKAEITIFHDYQFVYIEFNTYYLEHLFLEASSGPIYFNPENLISVGDKIFWRIPISQFSVNEIVKLKFRSYSKNIPGYRDPILEIYVYSVTIKDVTSETEITYKITPCCNPNE